MPPTMPPLAGSRHCRSLIFTPDLVTIAPFVFDIRAAVSVICYIIDEKEQSARAATSALSDEARYASSVRCAAMMRQQRAL